MFILKTKDYPYSRVKMDDERLAEYLEKIFFPPNMIGIGGILILTYLNWRLADVLTFVLSLLGTGIFLTVLRDKIEDRNNLYALSAGPSLPVFMIVSIFFNLSPEIVFGAVSMFLILTVGYLIRPNWKISGHTGAATAVAMVLSLINPLFLPLFILVPLVGWSRLELQAHTPNQVLAGFLLGITIPTIIYFAWL